MELSRAVGTTDRLWLFRASLMGAADAARAEECAVSIGPAGHGLRHPIPLVMKGRNRTDDAQIWHFAVNGSSPHVTRGLLRLLCGLFPVCLARLHFLVARRQLADWRWPRPFHSTFTTTPRTLAFSHPPTENEGKVKRDMASDASTWAVSVNLPEMTRETTPLHPQLHLSMTPSSSSPLLQRIISRHQPLRGSKPLGLSQRKGTHPAILSPLSRLDIPAGRRIRSPGGSWGPFPAALSASPSHLLPIFSLQVPAALDRVCLLASAYRRAHPSPPPPATGESSFVHHWGSRAVRICRDPFGRSLPFLGRRLRVGTGNR